MGALKSACLHHPHSGSVLRLTTSHFHGHAKAGSELVDVVASAFHFQSQLIQMSKRMKIFFI